MSTPTGPTKMRAWQYAPGTGFENVFHLRDNVTVPQPKGKQSLIRVTAASINPVDYKAGGLRFLSRLSHGPTATPGIDFAGRIASDGNGFAKGDRVYGMADGILVRQGSLGEYMVTSSVARVPPQVSDEDAASLGVVGLTARTALKNAGVKQGDVVLVNGASGGVGTLTVQMAKMMGATVVAVCSGRNVEFVQSLGADEIIDYTKVDLIKEIVRRGVVFDAIVDCVGNGIGLHKACTQFLKAGKTFQQVGQAFSFASIVQMFQSRLQPAYLGGAKRAFQFVEPEISPATLTELMDWVSSGKVKVVLDSVFSYEEAPKAYAKLREGRSRGKIVIEVSKQ